ncbi:restriction endonuclease subunit S [Fodinicurvata sediminis]|uniref:restriction endonuclease subunit S n=1 Tax=Fodinicurvata sediminis TaxID=1121832 RepID=UPI0003B58615|nr:restriction endonuclease subunit S [Fodinicurvata sediminis]
MIPMKYTARFINGAAFKPSDWGDHGKPIIRIAQLTGGEFDNFYDGSIHPRYEIDDGDLLFSWSATLDSFEWDKGPALLNQHIFKVEPNRGTFQRFLYYSLKHYSAIWADLDAHGSTMRHIKKESLGNKIWLPDFDTQVDIADFLDRETARIDQLIEKKQRLVEVLPEKEKGEISRLVLRGANPSAPLRDTGIFWRGNVPEHWTESRLKAHFRIQKRQGFDDLTVLSVYREYGVIEKSSRDDNINKTPDDLSKYQMVEPGDLVINKMKSWQGSLGISIIKGITSPDYVVMTPCGEHHAQYMHHLLRAVPMPTVYHLISNGIRIDQWRMEPDRFLSLPIFLPPIGEQEQIAQRIEEELRRLRNGADAINKSINRLREYRSALITAAVTGQIDVTTWGKRGETDRRLDKVEEDMTMPNADSQMAAQA